MSPIQWILAIAGIVGPSLVWLVVRRRKLYSIFPAFSNYLILYVVVASVGLAAYFYNCPAYFYVDWVLTLLLVSLEFGVIYEVLTHTLKSYSALADLAKIMFRWGAGFLLFMALVTALATSGGHVGRLQAAMNVIEHSVRLMECGLLFFLLVFDTHLGISWRSHGMCIAMGLGVYSAVDLIVSYLVMLPSPSVALLGTIDGLVYIGVLAFWGSLLRLPEPARKTVLDSPKRLIFQRWNEALISTTLARRTSGVALTPVESFLPGVEQTVERVMARKMMH